MTFFSNVSIEMEFSHTTRAQIVALADSGMKQAAIARQLNLSRQAVHTTLKRFRDTGEFSSRPRCGRPSVKTPQTDRLLKRLVYTMPTSSSKQLADTLKDWDAMGQKC